MTEGVLTSDDPFRCTFIRRNGKRCKGERVDHEDREFTVCRFHATAVLRAGGLIPDHVLPNTRNLDPTSALLEEVTRTRLHIAFYEDVIASLDPDELTQNVTTENRDGGPGGGFSSVRTENRAAGWLELLGWERNHLAQILRWAAQMNIDERQLALNEQLAGTVLAAMRGFVMLAGLDPRSPEVKQWMITALQAAQSGRVLDAVTVDRPALPG